MNFFATTPIALEAFKADQFDWIYERSANSWATRYDFPAAKDGRVIKEKFPTRNIGRMQGYAFNLRRPLFADARLRRAFNYAYDFEEMNRQLFFGEYQRDQQLFRRHRSRFLGIAGGPGAAAAGTAARQGSAGGLHHALPESRRRQSRKPSATTCERPCGC